MPVHLKEAAGKWHFLHWAKEIKSHRSVRNKRSQTLADNYQEGICLSLTDVTNLDVISAIVELSAKEQTVVFKLQTQTGFILTVILERAMPIFLHLWETWSWQPECFTGIPLQPTRCLVYQSRCWLSLVPLVGNGVMLELPGKLPSVLPASQAGEYLQGMLPRCRLWAAFPITSPEHERSQQRGLR